MLLARNTKIYKKNSKCLVSGKNHPNKGLHQIEKIFSNNQKMQSKKIPSKKSKDHQEKGKTPKFSKQKGQKKCVCVFFPSQELKLIDGGGGFGGWKKGFCLAANSRK